jgi:hypothetical protein
LRCETHICAYNSTRLFSKNLISKWKYRIIKSP